MTSVYVIAAEGGPVKIGIAANPQSRLAQLRTGTPFPLRLAHVEDPGELAAAKVEKAAHALLAAARTHGEWFKVTTDEARAAVLEAMERLRRPPPLVVPAPISFPLQVGPISPAQCRAARGLLSWSQGDLVQHCGLSAATIRAFERGGPMRDSNRNLLRMTFERAGVIFIPANGEDVGVRLRRTPATPPTEPHA